MPECTTTSKIFYIWRDGDGSLWMHDVEPINYWSDNLDATKSCFISGDNADDHGPAQWFDEMFPEIEVNTCHKVTIRIGQKIMDFRKRSWGERFRALMRRG